MLLTIQRSKLKTTPPHSMPAGRYQAQPWPPSTSVKARVSDAVAARAVSRTMAPIEQYRARSGTVWTYRGSAPATYRRKLLRYAQTASGIRASAMTATATIPGMAVPSAGGARSHGLADGGDARALAGLPAGEGSRFRPASVAGRGYARPIWTRDTSASGWLPQRITSPSWTTWSPRTGISLSSSPFLPRPVTRHWPSLNVNLACTRETVGSSG